LAKIRLLGLSHSGTFFAGFTGGSIRQGDPDFAAFATDAGRGPDQQPIRCCLHVLVHAKPTRVQIDPCDHAHVYVKSPFSIDHPGFLQLLPGSGVAL
jgi:hypothetical protein